MANIRFGVIVADARGKAGGSVFSKNKGGAYIRGLVNPVNPNSQAQQFIRGLFSQVAAAWKDANLSHPLWRSAAASIYVSNKVGEQVALTGNQYFQRVNTTMLLAGLPTVQVPPPAVAPPSVFLFANSASADINGSFVSVQITADISTGLETVTTVPAGYALIVESTPSFSTSKQVSDNDYRFIAALPAGTVVSNYDISNAMNTVLGGGIEGQLIQIRAYAVRNNGLISSRSMSRLGIELA